MASESKKRFRVYTIGHSTRPIDEFIEILQAQKLKLLIDVRKIPKSRFNPQYWGSRLKNKLAKFGIEYIYMEELGGRRPAKKDSVNTAWRNKSFQGYADHMQTEEFKKGLKKLISLSKRKRFVIMCAEAVPWRCHRSLIADALLANQVGVGDIFNKTSVREHKLTSFAKVNQKEVTYPKLRKVISNKNDFS